jgi:hypothetical protein
LLQALSARLSTKLQASSQGAAEGVGLVVMDMPPEKKEAAGDGSLRSEFL